MAGLDLLLKIVELDLESDRLHDLHAKMPERDALRQSEVERAAVARERGGIASRHAELAEQEEALGSEVAIVAAKAAEVEKTLYSGSVTVAKELAAYQEELRLLRVRQNKLEEREMELLEAIDGVDGDEARAAANDSGAVTESRELEARIATTEAEIAESLTKLGAERATLIAGIPTPVLAKYEALRENPRLGGRAAAGLGNGICEACRVKLPVMEYSRMKKEAPDALIQCSGCRRVLVR
jgi:predicted  nucleic acid-binding Zn-ribbon protein